MKVTELLKSRDSYLRDDLDPDPGQWLPSAHQLFSPWKLAVTSVHLQLILKELGRALNRESTREHALSNLEKVSRELFSHRITHEEAYYIGEVTRGVDDPVLGKVRGYYFNNSTVCSAVGIIVGSQWTETYRGGSRRSRRISGWFNGRPLLGQRGFTCNPLHGGVLRQ